MMIASGIIVLLACASAGGCAQEWHEHTVPVRLGTVSFPTSCAPAVQAEFNRGVALLHSFAFSAAHSTFRTVAAEDPQCAMAHWGVAMSDFHELWEPQLPPATLLEAQHEIEFAQVIGSPNAHEREYIHALSLVFADSDTAPFTARDLNYERAMADIARQNKDDLEAQVFYALALLSNASLTDKTHARQKQALAILEPLDRKHPDHPGITHYIIHACDSGELAQRGLPAARKYAQIAPDAPHALHMPSHIFTRLGLWQDSVASNLASSKAAREENNTGEELHAMDYLVYAYLQLGRYDDARQVIDQLHSLPNLATGDFKIGYSATSMPVRFAIEQARWDDAAKIEPIPGSPPHVAAIAIWAHALGAVRGKHPTDVSAEITQLHEYEDELHHAGNQYWAAQVHILAAEVDAWSSQANGHTQKAVTEMRQAADQEDAMEKSPATPGPIIPAREQLGYLLLQQRHLYEAAIAFRKALVDAPGRRGATLGLTLAQLAKAER
jgi:tetratricopeptide (TPR) repeat protein